MIDIQILPAFHELLEPAPFKGFYGGRGGAKSWQFTDALLIDSFRARHRVACLREYQSSIKESVHALICARIGEHQMGDYFKVTDETVRNNMTGTDFFFKGLKTSIGSLRSTFGITRAWIEEAEYTSDKSLEALLPTLRGEGAELWASWNRETEGSAIDKLFIKNPPTGAVVRQVGYEDNPYFPPNLEQQRLDMLKNDPVLYEHVWGGGYRKISDAVIFNKRVRVHEFITPKDARFYFGADFGFSKDPSVLLRMYITTNPDGSEELWIDYEAFGYGVELDSDGVDMGLADMYHTVPECEKWPIKGDASRPETISFLRKKGFQIDAAKKWAGSVEDGITHLKAFRVIHIHERCVHMAKEARLYSYKVDKNGNVLPIVVDAHNHGWDSARYGLDDFISDRGGLAVWEKLGRED